MGIMRPVLRRGGRVAEGAPLLREYTSKGCRGFESPLLRHIHNLGCVCAKSDKLLNLFGKVLDLMVKITKMRNPRTHSSAG